ncbi:hypothetical protein YQE_04457, partial [Dendroctonus ponderosae]
MLDKSNSSKDGEDMNQEEQCLNGDKSERRRIDEVVDLTLPLVAEESWKPWTGAIADHQLGVHPSDTPEVAVAKTQHLRAYEEVLAVLPQLPSQEDSGEENVAVFVDQPEENE